MGNTPSSQRDDSLRRSTGGFFSLGHENTDRGRSGNQSFGPGQLRSPTPGRSLATEGPARRDNNVYGTFRRQVSSQSVHVQPNASQPIGPHEVVFEQEERPLVNMEDLRMRDAPIDHIAATPLSRRTSTMSRLGSRFLPDSVVRGLQSSGEETPAEGQAHRVGLQNRITRATERHVSNHSHGRFSLRDTLRSRNISSTTSRRHSRRGPFPSDLADAALLQDSSSISDLPSFSRRPPGQNHTPENQGSWRSRARLSFVRNSMSLPLSQIFNRSPDDTGSYSSTETLRRSPRSAAGNSPDHLLPPLSTIDHRLDFENAGHEIDPAIQETEARNLLPSSMSNANSTSASGLRRFPHSLRSRSTRIVRPGPREQPPLAQVLHLAASAIAAQLSGHAGNVSNMQPIAGDGFDGSIQSFVRTLQNAASAQARNSDNNSGSPGEDDGHLPPVNFLRVFQFPNAETGGNNAQTMDASSNDAGQGNNPDRMDVDQPGSEERTVTLVLVGVRSMPHGESTTGDDGNAIGPSLDALLNLPFLPPSNLLRNGSSGALLRRSDTRTRFSSRRNSMSNFSSFPQQYDSQRHHRTRSSTNRHSATDVMPIVTPTSTIPSVLSESPPGPVPPPSTPAEPFLSGQNTPIRRPSSASAMQAPPLPDLSEDPSSSSHASAEQSPSSDASHYRRRSDSEFARRPELSSGATRRNGVVEPDTPPTQTGRSWLIYVVGTNVSPDHPAFTMPSLFTDNPTYEDMQLLSSMLGPAKPPVATQADVTSSGGIYRLVIDGPILTAEPQSENLPPITMQVGERCLICLCDYEAAEEIRQLNKCRHIYHKECVDEWLTTGRNSCPLCRGQGVGETPQSDRAQPQASV